MLKTLSKSVICCCALVFVACNAWADTTSAGGMPKGYKLVWSDEFDKPGLPDASKWGYDTSRNANGWYNNELQYYAADRPENARVENGQLIITAQREKLSAAPDYGGQSYTSARLLTRGKAAWTYGFFEVRAMLPCGRGTWPAVWTLGTGGKWPDDGELDILEQVGNEPARIFGTTHSTQSGGVGIGGDTNLSDACTAFHNYQMTWTADHIVFGVDNINYFEFRKANAADYAVWPFDKPQYLILNLAIGGNLGGPVDDNIFPVQMKIKHVRVFQ